MTYLAHLESAVHGSLVENQFRVGLSRSAADSSVWTQILMSLSERFPILGLVDDALATRAVALARRSWGRVVLANHLGTEVSRSALMDKVEFSKESSEPPTAYLTNIVLRKLVKGTHG